MKKLISIFLSVLFILFSLNFTVSASTDTKYIFQDTPNFEEKIIKEIDGKKYILTKIGDVEIGKKKTGEIKIKRPGKVTGYGVFADTDGDGLGYLIKSSKSSYMGTEDIDLVKNDEYFYSTKSEYESYEEDGSDYLNLNWNDAVLNLNLPVIGDFYIGNPILSKLKNKHKTEENSEIKGIFYPSDKFYGDAYFECDEGWKSFIKIDKNFKLKYGTWYAPKGQDYFFNPNNKHSREWFNSKLKFDLIRNAYKTGEYGNEVFTYQISYIESYKCLYKCEEIKPGKPTAMIEAPSEVFSGDMIEILGKGFDTEDEPGDLKYDWEFTCSSDEVDTGDIDLNENYPDIGDDFKAPRGEIVEVEKEEDGNTYTKKEEKSYSLTFKLTVTNNHGFSDTAAKTIKVNPSGFGNEPPHALLTAEPGSVKAGDDCKLNGRNSFDEDGYIAHYSYKLDTTQYEGKLRDRKYNNVWFNWTEQDRLNGVREKRYNADLEVTDNQGKRDNTSKTITVLPPTIDLNLAVTGTFKENRKITINAAAASSEHYPVTNIHWDITAVGNGADINSLRYRGDTLENITEKDILFKKSGKYKIKVTATNELGYTATNSKTIEIQKDLPPIVDFDTLGKILRDPYDNGYASMPHTARVSIPDNDYIEKYVWVYAYDSDNDGKFDDETYYYLDKNLNAQVLGNESKLNNLNVYEIDGTNKANVCVKAKEVGKYRHELLVVEGFGQPTIEEFITPQDHRTGKTF